MSQPVAVPAAAPPAQYPLPSAATSAHATVRLGTAWLRRAPVAYGVAGFVGFGAILLMLTWPTLAGSGGLWDHPGADLAQNLAGHLAAQSGPWHWPLLHTDRLAWPSGMSAAMTDSNPALILLSMAWVGLAGNGPVNGFGVWLGLCWFLQPVAAVYALRGLHGLLTRDKECPPESAVAVAMLSVMMPALIDRFLHINLLAHFLLLGGLGLVFRMLAGRLTWRNAVPFQIVVILVHPYLFAFVAILLLAPVLEAVAERSGAWRRAATGWLAAAAGPVLVYLLLSGGLGGADKGFGFFSMNLASPVWPQRSGLFGADLPIIDATGGQYEGFNYLGAGILLLVAGSLVVGRWRSVRLTWPVLVTLAGLTLLALTPRVYAGPWLLLPFSPWPWDQVFGTVRASGRAFWAVGYAALLFAVAEIGIVLPRRWRLPLLALCVVLQVIDTAPLRRDAQAYYAEGQKPVVPMPHLPAGMTLLRTVPVCLQGGTAARLPDLLRLRAIQSGARIADMRASRQPRSFNCESALSDALETPIRAGEVRAIIGDAAQMVRQEAFGPGAACRRQGDTLLCSRDLVLDGEAVPQGPALPHATAPASLAGTELAPVLATGWRMDGQGRAWSEGPRASLLFGIDGLGGPDAGTVTLTLSGVGDHPGQAREVVMHVSGGPDRTLSLADGESSRVTIAVPQAVIDGAPLWVAFDTHRPVDPARRGLVLPVRRAALSLLTMEVAGRTR